MKKISLIFLTALLSSCTIDNPVDTGSESNIESESNSEGNETMENIYDEDYSNIKALSSLTKKENIEDYFDAEYDDASFDFDSLKDGYKYENNIQVDFSKKASADNDYKFLFYNNDATRFINMSDGYALTIPTTTTFNADFSLASYRAKIYNEESTITITKENQNPYGNTLHSWQTYRDEWLIEYLQLDNWYKANDLELTRSKKFEDTTILSGYSIIEYDLVINNPGNITKCYYNIAVIRKSNDYINFNLIVMKSTSNRNNDFDTMIKSFTPISTYGKANNSYSYNLAADDDPNWNEDTINYYHKLKTQNYTDWGVYNGNLPNDTQKKGYLSSSSLQSCKDLYTKLYTDFEYNFDICSTYNHTSWYGKFSSFYFPYVAANAICGNGSDGKPVLQFTYQFTDNNNNVTGDSTSILFSPLIDIVRGKEDSETFKASSYRNGVESQLHTLAKAIKSYGKPVLFRLNNEMNTDWTSYCGMINLLDPDLFAASWRVLYRIFEEEGVDNCIWIFNPSTPSIPYSNWGMDLCYYPGNNYVQALGLTYYVMNNSNEATNKTFEYTYKIVYKANKDYFINYPWIISEFACGAGNKYQYQASQTAYVEKMFEDLNATNRPDYCKNIKGAVWFSCNDYSGDSILNALNFYKEDETTFAVTNTVEAFKNGLKNQNRSDK